MTTQTAETYRQQAERHRPADAREAVRDLAAQGLLPADIATALGVSEPAARSLLSGDVYAYRAVPLNSESAAAAHAAAWTHNRGDAA